MGIFSGFSFNEWFVSAAVLGGISVFAIEHIDQCTSEARTVAVQMIYADMQYHASILKRYSKVFKQDQGSEQCVFTPLGYQEFYNGYPETKSECGENIGFFDNLSITEEMRQTDLVLIENNHYSIVGYGSDESPERLMKDKCYAYYRMDRVGVDGHCFKIDTSRC